MTENRKAKGKQISRKPYGYVVSCPRIPHGIFFKTLKEAKKEMERQVRIGATQSGISEVFEGRNKLRYKRLI